jgi:transposase-like protein
VTQINNNEIKKVLQESIDEDGDFMKDLLSFMLQLLLEYERDRQIGVDKYERDDNERKGSRNGYKERALNTRLGKINLRKPQIREFPFRTMVFDNYQRSEKALLAAIQQMVIDGVSTAKVKKILGKLDKELSFSKSTVSRITMELDPIIKKWREQQLNEHYVYIILDAIYLHIRENGEVIKRPVLISIGVDKNGHRKVLGVSLGYQEDEATWRALIKVLKERGLISADLTISDADKSLVNALKEEFSGTPHQRCIVHFERNVLSKVPAKERKKLSKYLKQIYNAPDKEMALTISQLIIDKYKDTYPKVSGLLEEYLEETLTFFSYPSKHHRKIRTTNLIEYLNKLIKKRSKVVGIFPNAKSCIRYVSCVLMEVDEEWQTGRRYMRMDNRNEDESEVDEEFMEEIHKVKEGSNLNEELVAQ